VGFASVDTLHQRWCDAREMAPRRFARAGRNRTLTVAVWGISALSGCLEAVRGYDAATEDLPVEVPECGIGSLLVDVPEVTRPRGDASGPPEIPWCDLMYLDMPCDDSRFAQLPHCGPGPWYCVASPSSLRVCQGGCCGLRCLQPRADCDADPDSACDVDTWTDPRHCGGCGRACAAGESCLAGRCLTTSARLLGPISALRTLVRRPWFRWELPAGANGARLELCTTRGCERVEHTWDVAGSSFRPPVALALGVHFWRVTPRRDGALDATPSIPWEIWIGPAPEGALSSAAMADVNGDGEEDPVEDLLPPRPPFDERIVGRVEVGWYINAYSGPAALGDLNGDGFGDVGFLQVRINHARSFQNLLRPTELLVFRGGAEGATRASVRIAVGDACGLALFPVGDRDGDGYGDVAARDYIGCGISWHALLPIYGGAVSFGVGVREAGPWPIGNIGWIGHGDFDADGLEDLLATCGVSAACGESILVRPGARDRSLHTRDILVECSTPDTMGVHWYANDIVDHDDDGYDDLRSPPRSSGAPAVLPGGARGLDGTRCMAIP
jgi:hypothetical protein